MSPVLQALIIGLFGGFCMGLAAGLICWYPIDRNPLKNSQEGEPDNGHHNAG